MFSWLRVREDELGCCAGAAIVVAVLAWCGVDSAKKIGQVYRFKKAWCTEGLQAPVS